MTLNKASESYISSKIRPLFIKTIYCLYHLSPFGFAYGAHKKLSTLTLKIKFYYFFFPSKKKNFLKEIEFLTNKSREDYPFSYVFPYPFTFEYDMNNIKVFTDDTNGLFYVIHDNKRIYYSRDFKSEIEVQRSCNYITTEQDERSPHRYLDASFNVEKGDVVIDIGAAEGNFSLEVVERAGELYIFEHNDNWIEALNATFEPWKEKVHIIKKYVSDVDNDDSTTLDTLFKDKHIDFIKIDVEGAEMKILKNSKKVIANNSSLKMAVCTYHRRRDAKVIKNTLLKYNFNCAFTDGYMLFTSKRIVPPYFRHGLIRAQKKEL